MRGMVAGSLAMLGCCMAANAQPATPEMVSNECARQMSLDICTARPDRSQIKPGQTIIMSGVGRVSYSAYLDFMDLYNPQNPTATPMCKLALKFMKSEPNGDHAKIARALWTPNNKNSSQ